MFGWLAEIRQRWREWREQNRQRNGAYSETHVDTNGSAIATTSDAPRIDSEAHGWNSDDSGGKGSSDSGWSSDSGSTWSSSGDSGSTSSSSDS